MHGKFEILGALTISGVLLATAGGIAWHAFDVLLENFSAAPETVNQSLAHDHLHDNQQHGHHNGIDMDNPILALNMTLISIAVKEGLYWITKMAGERTCSGLMKANAWHHRADAVSSIVALVGVGGSILRVRFLDPLAGLLVSGMILKAGIESGYQSVLELVDAAVPSQHLELLKTQFWQARESRVWDLTWMTPLHSGKQSSPKRLSLCLCCIFSCCRFRFSAASLRREVTDDHRDS